MYDQEGVFYGRIVMFVIRSTAVGRGISGKEIGALVGFGVTIETSLLGRHGFVRSQIQLLANVASS